MADPVFPNFSPKVLARPFALFPDLTDPLQARDVGIGDQCVATDAANAGLIVECVYDAAAPGGTNKRYAVIPTESATGDVVIPGQLTTDSLVVNNDADVGTLNVARTSTFTQLATFNGGVESTTIESTTGDISSGNDLNAEQDANINGLVLAGAGYRETLGPFVQNNVPANQIPGPGVPPLNIGSPYAAGNARFAFLLEKAGWIKAFSVLFVDNTTGIPIGVPAGGSAHVTVLIGPPGLPPAPVPGLPVLTVAPTPAPPGAFVVVADQAFPFAAGSSLIVTIATDAGWTGTTQNCTAKVVVTG